MTDPSSLQLVQDIEAAQDRAEQAQILAASLSRAPIIAEWADANPAEWTAVQILLGAHRGLKADVVKWARAIEKARPTPQAESSYTPPQSLASLLRSIDPDSALESPPGYEVSARGVVRDGDTFIAFQPIVLLTEYRDIESREVYVELAWLDVGGWERATCPRSTITDSRKIGALADQGLDVSSGSASDLVAYLRDFGTHNRSALARQPLSRRCGWIVEKGRRSFLRGHHCHGDPVSLDAAGGLGQIADGLTECGDWSEMRTAIAEEVSHRPLLLLALYASLASPLLALTGAPGFVVDWSGPSGRGKSTALDMACAVWGNPDRIRASWETSSAVGPQEIAAFLHSIPLAMDDTNKVDRHKAPMIAQMLYVMPAGEERLRGQKAGGIRSLKRWRNLLLTTGEQPITSYAGGNAGAKRRAICLQGTPLGSVSESNAVSARRLYSVSRAHYGHLGASFVSALWSTPPETLKARHGAITASYEAKGVGSTDRSLASGVALLELASELARPLLPVADGERLAALEVAWRAAVAGGADSDEPLAALLELWSHVQANARSMHDPSKQHGEPPGGWIGAFIRDGAGKLTGFGVLPTVAHRLLEQWGRKPTYCTDEWHRRGWTPQRDKGRVKVRVSGEHRPRMYRIDFTPEVQALLD